MRVRGETPPGQQGHDRTMRVRRMRVKRMRVKRMMNTSRDGGWTKCTLNQTQRTSPNKESLSPRLSRNQSDSSEPHNTTQHNPQNTKKGSHTAHTTLPAPLVLLA